VQRYSFLCKFVLDFYFFVIFGQNILMMLLSISGFFKTLLLVLGVFTLLRWLSRFWLFYQLSKINKPSRAEKKEAKKTKLQDKNPGTYVDFEEIKE
jgi:NhaP-type Na+/H+ or K+/H+ antiporter